MPNELVTQSIAALKSGDKVKARQLLISAVKQNPNDEEAWSWLYQAVENNEQRIRCLQEVLRINPANDKARQALAKLQAPGDDINAFFQTPKQPQKIPQQPIIQTAACTSCGAPLKISPDAENINCSFCGASLTIQRSDGSIALKLAEKVRQAIQSSGSETQAVIQQGTSVTRDELRLIQLRQELSTTQLQFSTIRAEIRQLEREKSTPKITRQLRQLHITEAELSRRIQTLEETINPPKKVVPSTIGKSKDLGCSSLLASWRHMSSRQKKWASCGCGIMLLLCCGMVGAIGAALGIVTKTPTPIQVEILEIPTATIIERIEEVPLDTLVPTITEIIQEILPDTSAPIEYTSTPIEQPTQNLFQATTTPIIIPTTRPTLTLVPVVVPHPTSPPQATERICCKYCGSDSKPCGDSCISLKYTCHKPTGCACP
jgi:hypothetical protein